MNLELLKTRKKPRSIKRLVKSFKYAADGFMYTCYIIWFNF